VNAVSLEPAAPHPVLSVAAIEPSVVESLVLAGL